MKRVGWLFLFTFGLFGVCPMVFRGYYRYPHLTYAYVACGIGALAVCVYLLRYVPLTETLTYLPGRELYHRIPIDVRAFVAGIFLLWTIHKLRGNVFDFLFDPIYYVQSLTMTTLFVTLTLIQIGLLVDVIRDPLLRHASWRKSVVYLSVCTFRDSFLNRGAGIRLSWTLIVLFASGFGAMVVLRLPSALPIYALLFIAFTLPTLILVYRSAGYLNRIVENTSRIVEGFTVPDLQVKGSSPLAELAGHINRMKHGVEVSQAAQARSERLKTDLITNVSHDLRTPLTSIITYTELLKTPDLDDDNRTLYIEVLDQKSKRLKVLIDDLFEASKMASGNAELSKDRVDITQLLQQALAERDEAISKSGLDFRISKPESPVYCIVDGQKMWRVFDNLIGNILKYSLPHTRVYISVETSPMTTLTFKNIANYELNGDIDELLERFKRTDESRHTEGSGLGLAIAKSIVDLHGGKFLLDVDGDLFKATVMLPNEC